MSLKIWLPLNGTLDNKGASEEIIVTTAGTYTNGRICEKALSAGAAKISANTAKKILNNNEFSFCCWVYVNADTGDTSHRAMYFGNSSMGANNNRKFSIFQYPNVNDVHISWQNDTANATYASAIWSGVVPSRTWTHIAITYKNPTGTFYINGNKYATFSGVSNSTSFEYDTNLFENGNGYKYLSDYRVYDHCLSTAEVHEIAQGLVLHYKLDLPNKNYVKGSNTTDLNANTWASSFQTGDTTREIVYDNGTPCVKIIRGSTAASGWSYFHYDNLDRSNLKASTTYTISFDMKPSVDGSVSFSSFMNGNATNSISSNSQTIQGTCIADQWNHMVFRTTTIASITVSSQVVYMGLSASLRDVNTWVMMKNMKVEEGTNDTTWCPHVTDASYAILGYDRLIELDSTGFDHTGTYGSSPVDRVVTDSPHYNAGYSFSGNTAHRLVCNSTNFNYTDNFSWATWIKANYTGTAAQYLFTVGRADAGGYGYGIQNSGATALNLRYGNAGYNVTITTNTWTHIAFTKLGNTIKIYKNGSLYSTNTFSGTAPTYSDGNGLGIGCFHYSTDIYPAYGAMSDFRIYATALSAEDIKELYEVSYKIDNKDNIHGFNFNESGASIVLSKNTATVSSLSELDVLSTLKYDTNTYIEPDGSVWVRIFHHAIPASKLFSSGNAFANSCYIDADRWFNFQPCNDSDKWELMIKQKAESTTAAETKWRWVQTKNPLTAAFADVAASAVTYNTTSGYSSTTYGGLYHFGSNTYLCANNGTNGNWWGAVGAWSQHQSGIPAWSGIVVKTGYEDVYLRIDNLTQNTPPNAQFKKSGIMTAVNFIEM